ncbi:hypothetical protein [Aeromonas phage AerS_266]|nr:hypothetical protein [Aeromonas phage AerS_266]
MKKFYCFKQGRKVPKWMIDFQSKDKQAEFNNKKSKIVFAKTILAVRNPGCHTSCLLLKSNVPDDERYFTVKNMEHADVGGVNGATGSYIIGKRFQSIFGKNLHYSHSIVNGKEVLTQIK